MPTTSSRLNSPAPRPTVAALSRQYATWTAWVESGDWRQTTKTGRLALPANASDIMVLALDPDVSVAQLVHVTSRDQVLAARMLRLANSAYCGAMEEITTINEAVVRLGTASVRNVVLATCGEGRLRPFIRPLTACSARSSASNHAQPREPEKPTVGFMFKPEPHSGGGLYGSSCLSDSWCVSHDCLEISAQARFLRRTDDIGMLCRRPGGPSAYRWA